MSQKISTKNLHYDQTLPPFLARLRNQHTAAIGDGPDPLLAAHRRAAKPRDPADVDQDAPVIVDEQGHVVAAGTMRVGADGSVTQLVAHHDDDDDEAAAAAGERVGKDGDEGGSEVQGKKSLESGMIGGKRKRKVGKVVGAATVDDEEDGDVEEQGEQRGKEEQGNKTKSKKKDEQGSKAGNKTDAEDTKAKNGTSKGKKKAKKIKLSFGDGDDGD